MATQPIFPPTINVVPAGYRWSAEAMQKAAASHSFIRVGGDKLKRNLLSGAKRMWARTTPEDYRTVFSLDYRIAGTPEAIRTALQYANVAPDQIEAVLANAITKDNAATTKAADYINELNAIVAAKGTKAAPDGYEFGQIVWFGQNLKNAVVTSKTGELKGGVAGAGVGKGGRGQGVLEKYRKLAAGKVVDVSDMDLATGQNAKAIPAPKTFKSGKFGTNNIPIVSKDAAHYRRAIELVFGPTGLAQYANEIALIEQTIANKPVPMVGAGVPVVAFRAPSPPRVPGAVIAPPVVFAVAAPVVKTPPRTIGGLNIPQMGALGALRR